MEILVRLIDGTSAWVPLSVREVSPGEYEILDSDVFDPEDATALLQFVPGDVVRIESGRAVKLVPSSATDRAYWSTLYGVVSGGVPSRRIRRRCSGS